MALLQFGTTLVFGVPPLWNNENQPDERVRKMQAITGKWTLLILGELSRPEPLHLQLFLPNAPNQFPSRVTSIRSGSDLIIRGHLSFTPLICQTHFAQVRNSTHHVVAALCYPTYSLTHDLLSNPNHPKATPDI